MTTPPAGHPQEPKKAPVPVLLFVVLGLVLLVFFGWRQDWFGRELTDEQILERLDPAADPMDIQHALSQLENRLSPRFPGRERFRDRVVALKGHSAHEVRAELAWVMGREPAEAYHAALLELISDADPAVRLNAACSLANFNDARGRPILLQALDPVRITAPAAGTLEISVRAGDAVSTGRDLGRIVTAEDREVPLRASFNGEVREVLKAKGSTVAASDTVLVVAADPKVLLNALKALEFVGARSDLPAIGPFARGSVPDTSPEIQSQARRTLDALTRR